MKSPRFPLVLLACLLLSAPAAAQPRVIFDTDFGGDADDLGALVMLLNLMQQGEVDLLAVMSWSTEQYTVPAIDAIIRHYQSPDVPIGARQDDIYHDDWQYSRPIAEALGGGRTYRDVPHTTSLYRQILSEEADSSVTIVTVGPLLNILALLESAPDSISNLNGRALINRKVREVVIMGGEFPEGEGEWNFNGYMPGVTRSVLAQLDVPVVFSGFEVGDVIRTGEVFNEIDPASPLYIGYRHFSEHAPWMKDRFEGRILDNASYDQTAVLYAVRGGVGTWWDLERGGHVEVDESGDNRWIPGPPTNQAYLRLRADPAVLEAVIESIMLGRF